MGKNAIMYLIKNWYPESIKNPRNSIIKGYNPIMKWAKDLNRQLIKEDIQVAKTYMKICSTSMSLGNCKLKLHTY
jgi:hypothetical protein